VVIELDQMYWNFVTATSKPYWAAITKLIRQDLDGIFPQASTAGGCGSV
jgi:hypothetical protein